MKYWLTAVEDAVTRISWSLRAVNAAEVAAAAADMSATERLILQLLWKKHLEESNPSTDRRNPRFTIAKEELFKFGEQTPEYQM